MSIQLQYVFPIANTSDVMGLKAIIGPGILPLDGKLANPISNNVSFISRGYSRQISITSGQDISAARFTVTGIQNGVIISELIVGPNATTVYGTLIYDVITSISVNLEVDDVSIGTGYLGFFQLININLEKSSAIVNYSLSTAKLTATSIDTIIYNTNDNIFQNGLTFLDNIANNSSLFEIKASSADNQFFLPLANMVICRGILIAIAGDSTTLDNSIQMNFIQV